MVSRCGIQGYCIAAGLAIAAIPNYARGSEKVLKRLQQLAEGSARPFSADC